jgi:hypothetical protein
LRAALLLLGQSSQHQARHPRGLRGHSAAQHSTTAEAWGTTASVVCQCGAHRSSTETGMLRAGGGPLTAHVDAQDLLTVQGGPLQLMCCISPRCMLLMRWLAMHRQRCR